MIRGMIAATISNAGIDASPVVPSAIIVRKGPSFKDRTAMAPISVSSPNSFASAV